MIQSFAILVLPDLDYLHARVLFNALHLLA